MLTGKLLYSYTVFFCMQVRLVTSWYHLGMDFIGPLSPPSLSRNRFILTISDYQVRLGKGLRSCPVAKWGE